MSTNFLEDKPDQEELQSSVSEVQIVPNPAAVEGKKGTAGRPPNLSYEQGYEAFHALAVEGLSPLQIARRYNTTVEKVIKALRSVAQELGYSEVDIEFERFKLSEAASRLKEGLTIHLNRVNEFVVNVKDAMDGVLPEGKKLEELTPAERLEYFALNKEHRESLKTVSLLTAEFRQVNNQIAELLGIKKIRPKKKNPKNITPIERRLHGLSESELRELARRGAPALPVSSREIEVETEDEELDANGTESDSGTAIS